MNLPPALPKFELPENELHSYFINQSPKIIELLRETSKILRDPIRIELLADPCIQVGDLISIIPAIVNRKTLTGNKEVPGYKLITYEYYPGNRFEPPDVDEIELGEPNQNYIQIVIAALKWHVELVLNQRVENIYIEQSLREE